MDRNKRKRLEQAGWQLGSVAEFLELSDTEAALIEMKMSLGARLRKAREEESHPGRLGAADEVQSIARGEDGGR
jgi:hypothetical protein